MLRNYCPKQEVFNGFHLLLVGRRKPEPFLQQRQKINLTTPPFYPQEGNQSSLGHQRPHLEIAWPPIEQGQGEFLIYVLSRSDV